MNRILLMVLRNIFKVPGLWFKLCHYAKNADIPVKNPMPIFRRS